MAIALRNCLLDLDRHAYVRDGEQGVLSANEVALLRCLLAHPGETVSRQELQVALGWKPGVRTRAVDNAVRRLRAKLEDDPQNPEHLVSVYGAGYRLELPAVSAEARSAPAAGPPALGVGAFVGREPVLAAIGAALTDTPVVVLVGAGGVGKTRLALEVAGRRQGSVVCDLVSVRTRSDLLTAVAAALQIPPSPLGEGVRIAQLGRVLAARPPGLLVLDNFEQLPLACEDVVATWASEAPAMRFLLTSRRRAAIRGAWTLEVPPLDTDEGVTVFEQQARLRAPGFALVGGDRERAARLCERLDGLPLAIELAASRTGLMSLNELAARIERGLTVLRDPHRGNPRAATMQGAIRWSWDLLSAAEQEALAQCAVFESPFDLPDFEQVVRLAAGDAPEEVLEALVAHSLIQVRRTGASVRFRVLETIREFALERLGESGGEEAVRDRHAAWFCEVAGVSEGVATTLGDHEPLRARRADLMAAFRHAIQRDPSLAARLALGMDPLLYALGPLQTRRAVLAAVHERDADLPEDLGAEVMFRLADAIRLGGDYPAAIALLDRTAERARRAGDIGREGSAIGTRGAFHIALGRFAEAEAQIWQAIEIHRKTGDDRRLGVLLFNLANLVDKLGRTDEAEGLYREALEALERVGDRVVRPQVYGGLAMMHAQRGRLTEARALMEQALGIHASRVSEFAAFARYNLAYLEMQGGRTDAAERTARGVLEQARSWGHLRLVAHVLDVLGQVHTDQGRLAEALAVLDEARSIYRVFDSTAFLGQTQLHTGVALHLRGALHEARVCIEEGARSMAEAGPAAAAEANAHLGAILADLGEHEAARAALDLAERSRDPDNPGTAALVALCRGHLAWRETGDPAMVHAALHAAESIATQHGAVRIASRIVRDRLEASAGRDPVDEAGNREGEEEIDPS